MECIHVLLVRVNFQRFSVAEPGFQKFWGRPFVLGGGGGAGDNQNKAHFDWETNAPPPLICPQPLLKVVYIPQDIEGLHTGKKKIHINDHSSEK